MPYVRATRRIDNCHLSSASRDTYFPTSIYICGLRLLQIQLLSLYRLGLRGTNFDEQTISQRVLRIIYDNLKLERC